MRSKKIWNGSWHGRDATEWEGTIGDLRPKIPTFTSSEFKIGPGVNKYLALIARDPLGESDLGDEVNPMNSVRIPVAAVSKDYKLVQHCKVLDSSLKRLEFFSYNREQSNISEDFRFNTTPLKNPASLNAKMKISEYGARMRIEFLVSNYEFYSGDGNPYILKIICLNSVDRSIALRISLSLEREPGDEIFIAGFHRTHDQGLEDKAIEKFFNVQFTQFSTGVWIRRTVPDKQVEDLLEKRFKDLDIQKIRGLYKELTEALGEVESRLLLKAGEVNYFFFREALSALVHEQETLHAREQRMGKVLDFLDELFKESGQENNNK